MKPRELTIAELDQWRQSGAHWRVIDISGVSAEVELRTCTGEPIDYRQTHDPRVIDYLRTTRFEFEP